VTDRDSVDRILKRCKENYVINCAAITDIEYCELNQKKCYDVNTLGAKNIELSCKKYDKKLIHISSDYAVHPTNTYGLTKYLTEKILDLDRTLIIRTSFFDEEYFLIKNLIDKKITHAYSNVFFNPISSVELSRQIFKNKDRCGIVNIFTKDKVSKYEFATKVSRVFKIDKKLILKEKFVNKNISTLRPLDSYIKPDINLNLQKNIYDFKKWLDGKD